MATEPKNSIAASKSSQNAPAQKVSQQKLIGLDVVQLKSLRAVSLDFSRKPLTAIMGSNGCGKTTVLHAIACSFRPPENSISGYKFPLFFRPNSDADWKDSNFTIQYSQRVGSTGSVTLTQDYKKTADRWAPRYQRRPERYTRLVGIGESVPDIEIVNLASMVHYQKTEYDSAIGRAVREDSGRILNAVYESLYNIDYIYKGKKSIAVKAGKITYSGLSMSSGEQRVFRILEAVYSAPEYGLILIDEIDLFLHQDALQRMLGILRIHCEQKKKQLIFTTHFPPVYKMYDNISIYTLAQSAGKTVVFAGYSYEAVRQITGSQEQPISCHVEDDVAARIVAQIGTDLGIRKFIQIGRYGPAKNAFVLCGGLYLSNPALSKNCLAILDGDVYGSPSARWPQVKGAITGNLQIHSKQRADVMKMVRALKPRKMAGGIVPSSEQVLHQMLNGLNSSVVPKNCSEVHEIAKQIKNVPERHAFVDLVISYSGDSREVALSKIVELAALSTEWNRYTSIVRLWLSKKKVELNL